MLARLSLAVETRLKLIERMPDLAKSVPAWLDAHLEDVPMTWEIFLRGIAQMMAEHRAAIEQVVEDQVGDPEEMKTSRPEAPVPTGDEPRSELMDGVFKVLTAHTKALADIADHLERGSEESSVRTSSSTGPTSGSATDLTRLSDSIIPQLGSVQTHG